VTKEIISQAQCIELEIIFHCILLNIHYSKSNYSNKSFRFIFCHVSVTHTTFEKVD
jgi:hypothetical protein